MLPKERAKKCALLFHTAPVDENGTDIPAVVEAVASDCNVHYSVNKEDNKHISESNRLIKDREKEDFKKFWFTIPELRRINKPLTLKHWKEATHKESVETIQNAMELFVQRVEPQFIKTSYNWLKQEYWKSIPPAQEKVRKGFEYV